MNRARRLLTSPGFWIPLLLAGPILWALLPGGMPNTADGLVHFIRSTEMVHAWRDGVFIPRWAENLGLGYGIPLFVYAPPLPYFLTAAAHTLLGLPLDVAYKTMMTVAILIASYGAYRMGAALLCAWAGAVSAAAFLYAPIMLRELFIQGNIAQYLAWTFTPWAAWAVIRLYAMDGTRRQAGYALALACAIMSALLSHNAAALLIVGMTAGLAIVLLIATCNISATVAAMAGGALGLGLSAWFWIPALFEGRYVALDRIVASDFRSRFIALEELITLSPRLDTRAINPYYPLTLGAVQVWLGLAGALLFLSLLVVTWVRTRSESGEHVQSSPILMGAGMFFILLAAFCGFMATAWSEPIWSVLPFVDLFEWPFRWHGFTALGLAWLCAFTIYAARRVHVRAEHITALVALFLLMGSAVVNLYPHKLATGRLHSPAEVVRFESKTNAIGTTSLGEFNPIWVEETFNTSPLVEEYRAGVPIDRLKHQLPAGANGQQTYSSVHRQEFSLDLQESGALTLNLLYFPGWRAEIDDVPTEIRPQPVSGLIEIDVPAGEHTLTLIFGGTPLRRTAGAVSILAWIALAASALVLVRPRSQKATTATEPRPAVWPAIVGTAAISAIIVVLAATQPSLFRLHSQIDSVYPAEQPLHVDFADEIRLLGIDDPGDILKPGTAVTLVSYLRALSDMDEDYTAFLHLDDPVTGETMTTVDQPHPGGIPTSDWPTGLYVRNPLKLTVPAEADPIQYALRLGFYDSRTGDLLPLADGSGDVYEAGRIWVAGATRPRPADGPHLRYDDGLGGTIELLGVDSDVDELVLYWRTDARLPNDYSVFVHLLDSSGKSLGQLDGAPYDNRYPTSAWRPGQIIEDRRPIVLPDGSDAAVDRIAIGLYNPADGTRLSARDAGGIRLPDNALLVTPSSDR